MSKLKVLHLIRCYDLEYVEIFGDNSLVDVKITGCFPLQSFRFKSNSHRLEQITIQSSLRLTNLEIVSNSLSTLNLSGCELLLDDATHATCPNLKLLDIRGTSLSKDFYKSSEDFNACFVKRGAWE